MVNMRKSYDSKFREQVALEAVKGEKTLAELCNEFGVHGNGKLKYTPNGKQKHIGNGKQKCILEGKQKYTIYS